MNLTCYFKGDITEALANQYVYLKWLPQSAEQMKRMAEKEAKHIDLIKHLHDELQEQVTKASYLSEELKQVNQ